MKRITMHGFYSQILNIDLSKQETCIQPIKDEMFPNAFHKKLEDSGAVITKEEFTQLLADYKHIRGW